MAQDGTPQGGIKGEDAQVPIDPELRPPVASSSQHASPRSHENREELISRARAFLHSPQIQGQDLFERRRFLADKGLSESEINGLLYESAPKLPATPPRNYPQPPPSNLPTLLLGLVRLFSWIGMGSAALVLLYYRILLPRIIQTFQARRALRSHHISLMTQLAASLSSFKESQKEDYLALPHADPYREPPPFSRCKSVGQVLKTLGDNEPDYFSAPTVTLLRCAITDLSKGKSDEDPDPTVEEIFRVLEGRIPWLLTEEGYALKKSLYEILFACPLFIEKPSSSTGEKGPQPTWKYVPPLPPTPSPLVKSLESLSRAVPVAAKTRTSLFQHALESLSDFTGYISSQVYPPYHPPPGAMGMGNSYGLSPAEDQLKREIRSLKGLVLNRKSFMASIPRPGVASRPTG